MVCSHVSHDLLLSGFLFIVITFLSHTNVSNISPKSRFSLLSCHLFLNCVSDSPFPYSYATDTCLTATLSLFTALILGIF
jgi:hypothetical protein